MKTPEIFVRRPIDDESLKAERFVDALPREALGMSSIGVAHGYDVLRYGERAYREGRFSFYPVVQITNYGVQLLVLGHTEKSYIAEMDRDWQRQKLRRLIVEHNNYCTWSDLPDYNYQYLLSLHWVPLEPYTDLEIIARAVDF